MSDINKFTCLPLVLSLALALSSCQTISEMKANRDAKRAAADNAQCLAKGFTPNTDAFRLCMDNRGIERRVKAAEWEAWEANQKAEEAAQGATTSCILSGGVMIGSACVN